MDDLIAFLRARLDEDEAAAEAAEPGTWHARQDDRTSNVEAFDAGEWLLVAGIASDEDTAAHIARHDPHRALREVEAKRARLAYYEHAQAKLDHILAHPGEMSSGVKGLWLGKTAASRMACCHDAAVWRGHPGYRPEWKS